MGVQWVCKALSACSVWWECGGTCVTCVTRAMCIVGVQCPCHRRAMGVRGAECVGVCVLGVRWVCKGHAGRRARVVHGVSVCVCVCVCVSRVTLVTRHVCGGCAIDVQRSCNGCARH